MGGSHSRSIASLLCLVTVGHDASWNLKCLVCHVILQNLIIEDSSSIMSWRVSRYITTLQILVAIGTVVVNI